MDSTYLLGDPADVANWGDPKLTKGGEWAPLELVVAPRYRARFMFMGIEEAVIDGAITKIYLYKHDFTHEYVNVDSTGQLFEFTGDGYVTISLADARSRLVGHLVHMIEQGLDVNYDITPALEKLGTITGLSLGKRKSM